MTNNNNENKNKNKNNFDMLSPMLWLDGDNLAKKIVEVKNWLAWYNDQIKKLDYMGKDHFLYMDYNKQIMALKKILEALYCIRDNSKILLGE